MVLMLRRRLPMVKHSLVHIVLGLGAFALGTAAQMKLSSWRR
jgi:hypothetical protein